jgi:hypothetical protein
MSTYSVACTRVTSRKSSYNELGCEVHVLEPIDTAQGADLNASLGAPRP